MRALINRLLDGGPDGLILAGRLAEAACGLLAPGGAQVLETGPHEVPKAAATLGELGYHE